MQHTTYVYNIYLDYLCIYEWASWDPLIVNTATVPLLNLNTRHLSAIRENYLCPD